jgi:hypothetical protein
VRVADQKLDLNFVLDRALKHQKIIESIVIDEFHRIKNTKFTHKAFFNVGSPPEIQQMVSWMSCGYPYIVHKLALQACFAWLKRSLRQFSLNMSCQRP